MSVTMKDIAEASGVSRSMVSHVLNGRTEELRIAQSTKEKVLLAAEELGYCRNQLARSVVTGRSRILAFVMSDMGVFNYTGRIQKGILQSASNHDYSIKVYQLKAGEEKNIIKELREWQVAGVIFHVPEYKKAEIICKAMHKFEIPVAFVNLADIPDGIGVTTDDETGARLATDHLLAQTRGEVIALGYPSWSPYIINRYRGYETTMVLAKHPVHRIMLSSKSFDDQLKEFLPQLGDRFPIAFFCVSDILAMLVMRAALIRKLEIGKDILLCGFGDLDMGFYAPVPLSSVHQDYEAMGELATEELIRQIEQGEHHTLNLKLETKLIIRASSSGGIAEKTGKDTTKG